MNPMVVEGIAVCIKAQDCATVSSYAMYERQFVSFVEEAVSGFCWQVQRSCRVPAHS